MGKLSGSILEVVVRPARSIVNEMFFYLKKKTLSRGSSRAWLRHTAQPIHEGPRTCGPSKRTDDDGRALLERPIREA